MTAINFTNSPSNGDTTTVAGVTYTYNSTTSRWEITSGSGGGGSAIEVGTTAPSTPAAGQLWWDSSEFTPYIYYTDTDSSQWVEFSPGAGGGGGSAIEVGTTAPSTPAAGQLWWDSSDFTPYIYYTDSTGSQWVEFSPGDTGSGGAAVEVGTAAPGSPSAGQLWWDSSDFTPYVYYNDGTSSQWVEFVATSQSSGSAATLTTARNIGGVSFDGSADIIPNIVTDTTPQLGGPLDVNGQDIVTISNGDIDLDPNGSGVVVFKGNATKGSGQFKLNCENNSHGITIKGPPHSAGASYTLTLPDDDGTADQVLKTDGSGALSWGDQGGVATYATMALLIAATGMTTSDLAFVTANNNLYLYTGTGWFKVATVENNSPTAITGVGATTVLAADGTASVITAVSTDPEGFPLTWSYAVTTGSLTNGGGATATVSQADNVFTITPTTTSAYAGSFSITFSATDGTNAVTAISAFTLTFGIAGTLKFSTPIPNPITNNSQTSGLNGTGCMNDDYYILADYRHEVSSGFAGRVYLFNKSDKSLAYTLSDSTAYRLGQGGVAVSGNLVVVSQPDYISGGVFTTARKVRVYDISTFTSSTVTSPNYILENPAEGTGNQGIPYTTSTNYSSFAADIKKISVSGNYIVIADSTCDYSTNSTTHTTDGIVYIWDYSTFSSSNTTPSHNWHIWNPNAFNYSKQDYFGNTLSADGDYLVCMAYGEDRTASDTKGGVAYVYDLSALTSSVSQANGSTAYLRTIVQPNYGGNTANVNFGAHTGMVNNGKFILGTPASNHLYTYSGVVYIFDLSDGSTLHTIEGPYSSDPGGSTTSWVGFGNHCMLDGDNVYIQSSSGYQKWEHFSLASLPSVLTVSNHAAAVENTWIPTREDASGNLGVSGYAAFAYNGELMMDSGFSDSAAKTYIYE
jgi:hypothetical protein